VSGFVDLHCHWVAGVDDGVRSSSDGIALLAALYDAGFDTVVATPHMRPSLFDNTAATIRAAYDAMAPLLEAARQERALPYVHLASEHFFDDLVFDRLRRGEGLAYAGGGAVLVEFPQDGAGPHVPARLFDLRKGGLVAVVAHPERYRNVWDDDRCLDGLIDAGAHLLLDVCALVGKYGRASQRAAEKLLEEDAYEAACSDAHRVDDAAITARAIERLRALVGDTETCRLLRDGPRGLLGLAPVSVGR
jgi:protein-tyrosine phosphatase